MLATILKAGAVVGVLDGLYVVIVFAWLLGATTSHRIFQGIARSVLGPSAFDGGFSTFFLGVAMHFGVAIGWAACYAVLYRQFASLRRATQRDVGALWVGAIYGLVVWAMMNVVILPFTLAPPRGPLFARGTLLVILAHLLVVGPPITLLTRPSVRR